MSEVNELASSDIQRPPAAAPTGAPQPQGFIAESGQPAAEMSADQQAGVAELAQMRNTYAANPERREVIAKAMAELAQHVFHGGPKPAGYGAQKLDARMTSTAPHDALADSLTDAAKTLTTPERELLEANGKAWGLNGQQAGAVGEFASFAQMDRSSANQLMQRVAHHASNGFPPGATISAAEHAEFAAESARSFGSRERWQTESGLARAFVEHIGVADWIDKNAGSLQYDPGAILALSFRARVLGLKPAHGKAQ